MHTQVKGLPVMIDEFLAPPQATLREVIAIIDKNAKGIALIVNDNRQLIATITDGDLRRAFLANVDLNLPISAVVESKSRDPYPVPITSTMDKSPPELLNIMESFSIRHLPLLNDEGTVADLAFFDELAAKPELPLQAVVMAGGYGTRLRPLTTDLPKPMLPLGDRPLLEHMIEQLAHAGIRHLNLTTHYKGAAISDHFGDGSGFGVDIQYVQEDQPLGTAGALRMVQTGTEPLLVINGDVLTGLDFRLMLDFHKESCADMTIAVRHYELTVPYGVIETEGIQVKGISEKPDITKLISAGIYLLSPKVCSYIPKDGAYDMPDLINQIVENHLRVVSFPVHEYWLDIGQASDYSQAQEDLRKGKV